MMIHTKDKQAFVNAVGLCQGDSTALGFLDHFRSGEVDEVDLAIAGQVERVLSCPGDLAGVLLLLTLDVDSQDGVASRRVFVHAVRTKCPVFRT